MEVEGRQWGGPPLRDDRDSLCGPGIVSRSGDTVDLHEEWWPCPVVDERDLEQGRLRRSQIGGGEFLGCPRKHRVSDRWFRFGRYGVVGQIEQTGRRSRRCNTRGVQRRLRRGVELLSHRCRRVRRPDAGCTSSSNRAERETHEQPPNVHAPTTLARVTTVLTPSLLHSCAHGLEPEPHSHPTTQCLQHDPVVLAMRWEIPGSLHGCPIRV